jgi:hypothetical protein
MAKYRVLRSAAHNYGASFISVMNMISDDYAICEFVRTAKRIGLDELRVNLLTGAAEPPTLVSQAFARSIAGYVDGFGAHIQRSGSALDMISSAELTVTLAWSRAVGRPDADGVLRARLHCAVSIVDDRGVRHDGETSEAWVCHSTKRFY